MVLTAVRDAEQFLRVEELVNWSKCDQSRKGDCWDNAVAEASSPPCAPSSSVDSLDNFYNVQRSES